MKNLYKFKWPFIFFSLGLIFEKLHGISRGDLSIDLFIIGSWLQLLALVAIIWKLLFVENK